MCTPMSEVTAALSYGAREMQDGARGGRRRVAAAEPERLRATQVDTVDTPSTSRPGAAGADLCGLAGVGSSDRDTVKIKKTPVDSPTNGSRRCGTEDRADGHGPES